MKDADREKLVEELTAYVYQMAPHQKVRMGGQLILRALDALKTMRVLEDPTEAEIAHRKCLLAAMARLTAAGK